ncbi:AMP-binding protein [soil metagenome]
MDEARAKLAGDIRRSLNQGDRLAIEYDDRAISWEDARVMSASLGEHLDRMGVARGQRIGLIARSRPSHVLAMWGILANECCVSMIYSAQSTQRIAQDIGRVAAPLVIAEAADWTADLRAATAELGAVGLTFGDGRLVAVTGLETLANPALAVPAPDVAVETLSSGTTGTPKRIALSWQALGDTCTNAARTLEEMYPGDDPAPFICAVPLGNMAGVYAVFPAAAKGHPMAMMEKFNLPGWLERVRRYRPPAVDLPCAGIQMLMASDVDPADLASIKWIRSGSAPLDPAAQRKLLETYGIPVNLAYGASEFCGVVTAWSPDDLTHFAHAKLGSCGRALPGVALRIVSAEGEALPVDEPGLLEARVERIGPDWIRTTDICRVDADGFLWFSGRSDDVIMRGGFKIAPEKVETALRSHGAILDAAVCGVADARLCEVPVAVISLRNPAHPPAAADREAHARAALMAYEVPVRFQITREVPRNPAMKIDRRAVRALVAVDAALPLA